MASTAKGYPYPAGTDPNNVPADLQALAEAVDASPGIRAYTQAEIDALPAAQKWVGRKVWNVTAGVHQNWNGAQWVSEGGASTGSANTWTEDQTIEDGNHWLVGTRGAALLAVANSHLDLAGYNWDFDGANYVRRLGDNAASLLRLATNGDLIYYTATDAGATVGSVITWGEKLRVTKSGSLKVTGLGIAELDRIGGDPALALTRDGVGVVSLYGGAGGAAALRIMAAGAAALWATINSAGVTSEAYMTATRFVHKAATDRFLQWGSGSPEGVVTAAQGSLYGDTTNGRLYVKNTGTGNTGWLLGG